ncbi:gamma-butyrobetaine hydroxylase-like domain-containing protein [Aeoliella sp.]|uniref:gamma-butyrobetaine hydroxylase-like domain-containing protein n=1 Tax=Aeoliella sp. TaxID=2795800 RepID=UPI003CCBA70E
MTTPTKLEKPTDDQLRITWSDDTVREYTVRELRDACPCATCREKRNAPPPPDNVLPVLPPGAGAPLAIAGMRPTGNYAYNISFSDGHNSGLYTLDLLRELGTQIS